MPVDRPAAGLAAALLAVLALAARPGPQENARAGFSPGAVPKREELFYRAEWRLVHAGNVRLSWGPAAENGGWKAHLKLQSAGLVSRLHRVDNEYIALMDAGLCATSSTMRAHEGRRRREILVHFDGASGKASYLERDLARDAVVNAEEVDIPGCVHDLLGGLYRLRAMRVEPGQVVHLPVSDGRKSVSARVEAQAREKLRIGEITYQTIRYEAFLFNNVLYRRSGRLFVWLTDDERRLPVQIRVRLPFYIGTVTLELRPEGSGGAEPASGGSP